MPRVVLDIQGTQSVDHRDRGIARYIADLANGLLSAAPELVAAFTFNPDLPLPGGIEPLVASGRLRPVDEVDPAPGTIVHLASPIELAIPFRRLVPPAVLGARLPLVVTLFDLIPELFADRYLVQPGIRRRYRTRLELVRAADRVLAISRSTADDARRHLGVQAARVDVIPLAASDRFTPVPDREVARRRARALVPGLGERFVLYTGGQDFRKNMERLVDAWALVPDRLRATHQLVLACNLDPPTRNHFRVEAERHGFGDKLLVTGFVSDEALVSLNQAADLVVFPSLYEGFGLPVVEALACGTPVVSSNRSSLPELLPPEATFDPDDPMRIAAAVATGLTDERLRRRVVEEHERRRTSDVVADTIAAYERVAHRTTAARRPRRASRPTIALCSPLPPVPGGVSDFTHRLLETLPEHVGVDAYVDGPPHHRAEIAAARAPGAVPARPVAALDAVEAARGRPYDAVVWTLGNSEYHTGALAGVLRRGGIVLAHEVRLVNLYRFARWQHPHAVPGGFHATLHRMYQGLPERLGEQEQLDPAEAERWGVFMARDVIAASTRFLVTSPFAAELARLDARAHDRHKVVHVPFAVGAVAGGTWARRGPEADFPLIVSFGGISALKQTDLLIAAFAVAARAARDARLVLVGAVNDDVQRAVDASAEAHGVRGLVQTTGEVDADTYRSWLSRAWVAVQLRATTNGESSGAAGDCYAAGVPTVVSAIGAARAVPPDATVHVPADVTPDRLGAELAALVGDPDRRAALSRGALAHASRHTYPRAAVALAEAVLATAEG